MKLRLILPRAATTNNAVYRSSLLSDAFLSIATKFGATDLYSPGKRSFYIPPLNLMVLAACVPSDVEVEILDERTIPSDHNRPVDLVGITCITADAYRAYEIADDYRTRHVPVILGGIHPTVLPDEAAQHADSVVVGEAETLMSDIIQDYRCGHLKARYQAEHMHSLENLPRPRKDLIDDRYYITRNVIQATRGCPHRCAFCSTGLVSGFSFRKRPVSDIVAEVTDSPRGFFVFLDDNLTAIPQYAEDLCRALSPLHIYWYGQTTVATAQNERLITAAAESGCKILLIGFESLSQQGLEGIKKHFNTVTHFTNTVRRIHRAGIAVIGTFMLGLDDAVDDFERIIEFANGAPLDLAQVSILTPYPGTALHHQLQREGRILTRDWRAYDTTLGCAVFQPRAVSPDRLRQQLRQTYERLYSYSSIAWRLARSRRYVTFFLPYNLRQRAKLHALRTPPPIYHHGLSSAARHS